MIQEWEVLAWGGVFGTFEQIASNGWFPCPMPLDPPGKTSGSITSEQERTGDLAVTQDASSVVQICTDVDSGSDERLDGEVTLE
jgi:hypothetical protein